MKAFKTLTKNLIGSGGGNSNDDDTEDRFSASSSILADHRELSYMLGTEMLPKFVADPGEFPFYVKQEEGQYVAQTRIEADRAVTFIRDEWIRNQMISLEPSFTVKKQATVFVGTYNVNGKKPPSDVDLSAWLGGAGGGGGNADDIVVVGFQEIVDLSVSNALSDSQSKERSALWIDLIQSCINSRGQQAGKGGYTLIATKTLFGIMICAFVISARVTELRAVQTGVAATGVLGMVGNKGGCSIRFELNDTSFCFVAAHLAAHTNGIEERNANVRDINAKTVFKLDAPIRSTVPDRHHSRVNATTQLVLQRNELSINDHDYVIWLGDFNYRMDASKSAEEVLGEVTRRNFLFLYENDQLVNEMKARRVFRGFDEVAPVVFLPTYKFEPGTDRYEQREDKKLRAPSWTDRIVWKPTKDAANVCLKYDKVNELRMSDHKPVFAQLGVHTRIIHDDRRAHAYNQEVLRKLSSSVSDDLQMNDPNKEVKDLAIAISKANVDFGVMKYRQLLVYDELEFKNTAGEAIAWRFVARPASCDVCSSWLSLTPTYGMLLPGEVAKVKITALFGLEEARLASSYECSAKFMDVLDIRFHPVQYTTVGRTVPAPRKNRQGSAVVTISATLDSTSFGRHLTQLVWLNDPIRSRKNQPSEYALAMEAGKLPPLSVPKELWRLVEYMVKRDDVLGTHRLFFHHCDSLDSFEIREALDTGAPLPQVSPHAYACVLLEFVDCLNEPVVPPEMCPLSESEFVYSSGNNQLDGSNANLAWIRNFFKNLPSINSNVLMMIILFIRKVLQYSTANFLSPEMICTIFADVLFRPSLVVESSKEASVTQSSSLGEFASWLTTSATKPGLDDSKTNRILQVASSCLVELVNSGYI